VTEAPARLEYYDKAPTSATARIVSYGKNQRITRATTAGLACWGLAALSVLVPLGHFILVPAFLLAGPVVFLLRLGEGISLRSTHGICPACAVEQEFTEHGPMLPRHPVRCSECGRQLVLTLIPPPPTASESVERLTR
jgi:hypothetical protein